MDAEPHVVRRWRVLGTLAGVALAGTVGAGVLAGRPLAGHGRQERDVPAPAVPIRRLHEQVRKLPSTWPRSTCVAYPWLNFTDPTPLWNNLGNKGPGFGVGDGEGLVYRTVAMGTGWGTEMGRKVLLIFNGTNAQYRPFSSKLNGRSGFYGSINLQSGSFLNLKVSFKDEKTMKPLQLKQIAMTFFDLDMGKFGQSMESVAANKFKEYYVEPHTETKMFKVPGVAGLYKYDASTYGDGADNPKDPTALTQQQKNRAVTFLFEDVNEVNVTIAASPNAEINPRFFTFVMRPSLLCQWKDTLDALPYTPPLEYAVPCGDGMTFARWLKSRGDTVKKGDDIVLLMNKEGKLRVVHAERDGTIVKTADIKQDESCSARLLDTTIAVVKIFTIPALQGSPAAVAEKGQTFVKFVEPVGAIVEKGNPIAIVDSPHGEKILNAPTEGYITSEQTALEFGDPVEIVEDKNLAAFGKLRPLKVTPGEGPANAPQGRWLFRKWMVDVDDVVAKGDPVAVLEDNQGVSKTVSASKDGTIVSRQERMKPGYELDRLMSDTDLAVIGKFQALEPKGLRATAVSAPEDAIFVSWKVHKGDYVEKGDPVAEVQLPGRRLSDGRMLAGTSTIRSPAWGTVTKEQPLVPGERIGDQQLGPNIATLDMGTPWWVGLLTGLLVLCCLLCCIFAIMKKPKPPDDAPEEPDGLRLDFEEAGQVRTVYAKYRPLGIKHNDTAPIVAHEFTVNSYAKQALGVREGWKLRRIGDEELNDNPDFGEVNSKLHSWMKDFPLWPLPMVFEDESGETKAQFLERPLGFEFSNSAPVYVSKVHDGSPAHEQGVKEGMLVAEVGEMDVRNNSDFHVVLIYFQCGAQALDHNGKTYSSGTGQG